MMILGVAMALALPGGNQVQPLPELASVTAWSRQVREGGAELNFKSWPGALGVFLVGSENQQARMQLQAPLDIPDWATGFTFLLGNDGDKGRIAVRAVVVDAKGREFLYKMLDSFPVFKMGFRSTSQRLNADGLFRVQVGKGQWDTIIGANSQTIPERPLRLIGLQFETLATPTEALLSLKDFAFTRLVAKDSDFYYGLEGRECFGELDPVPYLTLADLGPTYGRRFDVAWQVRDRFDGPPILEGHRDFVLEKGSPEKPYSSQLEQRLEFPVEKAGAYWIDVRLRWSKDDKGFPQTIEQRTFRLDVLNSRRPEQRIAKSEPIGIRIAPDQDSVIFAENKPFVVPFEVRRDAEFSGHQTARIRVRPYAGGEIVKEVSLPLPESGSLSEKIDLSDLGEGAWVVRVELLAGDQVVDAFQRVVGREITKADPASVTSAGPSSDPTNGKSHIVMFPHIPDGLRDDPVKRWEAVKPFLDQAGAVADYIELPVRWKDLEAMPGVFDWTWLDKVVNYAQEKGLKLIFDPQFVGMEPDWVPPFFTRNRDGAAFGHQRYLFRGMRVNFWQAEPARQAALNFFRSIASRYASHPAVRGYLILTEHPGEFPYAGWYDGFSQETLANFETFLEGKYSDIKSLNEAWGTQLASWSDVGPPEATSSERHWLDWLTFRRGVIGSLLLDEVRTVRQVDPDALIELYTDGLDEEQYPELRKMGVMLANGGSHEPELFSLKKAALAVHGLQERAEERSVGNWAFDGPTQLDGTLFTMMQGGGGNAHCKMFVPSNLSFDDLRKSPRAFDRFEHFIPIWRELRPTTAPKREMFILNDTKTRLLQSRSTAFVSFGGSALTKSFLESQLVPPMVGIDVAVQGKLIFFPSILGTSSEESLLNRIVAFVEQGGTLVMNPETGRTSPDLPGQDWILLRRLGWAPPVKLAPKRASATTVKGEIFPAADQEFILGGPLWQCQGEPGNIAARFIKIDPSGPAISWKPFGKGKVLVIWASELVPPSRGGGHPFLTEIAQWSGITLPSHATAPLIYTNLLKHTQNDNYYGLAYHSGSHTPWGQPGPALDAATQWTLPPGRYRVTELITGTPLGEFSSDALAQPGLPCPLKQHEVAIYRMELLKN